MLAQGMMSFASAMEALKMKELLTDADITAAFKKIEQDAIKADSVGESDRPTEGGTGQGDSGNSKPKLLLLPSYRTDSRDRKQSSDDRGQSDSSDKVSVNSESKEKAPVDGPDQVTQEKGTGA